MDFSARVRSSIGYLSSVLLLAGFLSGCATVLADPAESTSALVIGRVIIDNRYQGQFFGPIPLGIIKEGIEVEVASPEQKQLLNVRTDKEGYFYLSNIPPSVYQMARVSLARISGGLDNIKIQRLALGVGVLRFRPVPGKIGYIGTLMLDVDERAAIKKRELREGDRAREYFFQKHGVSAWASREFIALRPGGVSNIQTAGEKAPKGTGGAADLAMAEIEPRPTAERPEWRTGYEWKYAWRQAGRSGTVTSEVVREELFAGVSSYVVRTANNEEFYTKDALGLLGHFSGGRLLVKYDDPYQYLSWPLAVGKEWRNTFVRENIPEKSSETIDIRVVVADAEQARVPAGTFEAFKIEIHDFYSGNLIQELWYSPETKWIIKSRVYANGEVSERELISFKAN